MGVSPSSESITLSAGSEIPLPQVVGWIIDIYYYDIPLVGQWDPMETYWELYNPANKLSYKIAGDVIYTKHLGHWPPVGLFPGYDKWEIHLTNPKLQIPAFAGAGTWQLKLVVCDKLEALGWDIKCITVVSYINYVGESSLWDNLFAPIYITWGGVPAVGWGDFSFALPCLFILSCPIWGFGLFYILLIIWYGSFKVAHHEIMNGLGKIRRKNRKNGGTKNVKK